jgi:hypothetical protein
MTMPDQEEPEQGVPSAPPPIEPQSAQTVESPIESPIEPPIESLLVPSVAQPPSTPHGDPTGQIFVAADDEAPLLPDEPESEAAPRTSALRTATVVSGRIILGFVVLGVIAIVVAAATLIPLPGVHASVPGTVVTPVPTAAQLVCPGGLLRIGTSTGADASQVSPIGSEQVVSGAIPGDVIPRPFATTNADNGGSASAPLLLTTPPVSRGTTAPLLAGAQSESVSTSEFVGLAAAGCSAPSGSGWLAGGATSVGRTTLLLLANPTDVDATVSLQIFGEAGEVTAPGMDGITVAADSQDVLSIAGFAPGLVSPVLHVTSAGGQVVASLEQSTIRGLDPGGIDFVSAQAVPQDNLVIPGVVVSGTQAIQGIIGGAGYDDLQSTLRIFAPGNKATTVTITTIAENGTVTGTPTKLRLQPGEVTDFALDSLSDGNYTLLLSSALPIVASARVSTAGSTAVGGVTDFAWVTAAPLLTGDAVFSIADGMTSTLHLDNPTGSAETVRLHALAGQSLTATVAAHSATSVPVAAGISYELEGVSQLYASVSGATDGGVTSYVVSPPVQGAGPLKVFG